MFRWKILIRKDNPPNRGKEDLLIKKGVLE